MFSPLLLSRTCFLSSSMDKNFSRPKESSRTFMQWLMQISLMRLASISEKCGRGARFLRQPIRAER